jgi:hypothetical protein
MSSYNYQIHNDQVHREMFAPHPKVVNKDKDLSQKRTKIITYTQPDFLSLFVK